MCKHFKQVIHLIVLLNNEARKHIQPLKNYANQLIIPLGGLYLIYCNRALGLQPSGSVTVNLRYGPPLRCYNIFL